MPDRGETIEDLKQLAKDDWILHFNDTDVKETAKAALAMLKEQEPVRVGKKIKAGDVMLDFYECGYCKNAIRKPWKYCPFCGKAVKWIE